MQEREKNSWAMSLSKQEKMGYSDERKVCPGEVRSNSPTATVSKAESTDTVLVRSKHGGVCWSSFPITCIFPVKQEAELSAKSGSGGGIDGGLSGNGSVLHGYLKECEK